jgi:L-fucose isomerase-like protein
MTTTLGVIIGNRDFFPDHLVTAARADIEALFSGEQLRAVMLGETDSKLGGVETHSDAVRCAELFRSHVADIDGVLVVLPNFGDEKGVADTLKLARLEVPVLVQAYPDELDRLDPESRRDAFCGKISVCNNLRQYGIPFTVTRQHTAHPGSESFKADLRFFAAVCRVVRGMRSVRIGAVGARPGAFNTVRYSEKILERNGISVTTIDLSEILAAARQLSSDEARVQEKIEEINRYANTKAVPADKLQHMATLDLALADFVSQNALDATAIQCWTSVQGNQGCNICTSMSMMSESMRPSACEVDVTGALTMYAMQLASGSPSALVDWNNNYGDEEDRCVLFHCGNWARSFIPEATVSTAPILGSIVGAERTWGALEGRTPARPLTFGRLTTDDCAGTLRAYVGEGNLTDDPLRTFGNRAVAYIPRLQELMRFICENGFEHHVVMNASYTANILAEALGKYLGWEVYVHTLIDSKARESLLAAE